MQNDNPFGDDNEIDDPFLNDSSTSLGLESSQPALLDVPMPKMLDPISHIPKYSFKIAEDVHDAVFASHYLITCSPLKLTVWDVITGKVISHLQHNFEGFSCCCILPEFEDPSIFIWLGLSNGDIWCIDVLGQSLESERHKMTKYSNIDLQQGCIVLYKKSHTRSPIKRLFQKGTTIIAVDAYASFFIFQKVDASSLNDQQPIVLKLPISITNNIILDRVGTNLFISTDTSACYFLNFDLGISSFQSFASGNVTCLCIGEFDSQNCLITGHDNGFIQVYSKSLILLKTVHFSNQPISSLKFRPSNCFINDHLASKPVLLVCLKTGDFYQCILDHEFCMISMGHPTDKTEDIKILNAILILQEIGVDPYAETSLNISLNFATLSRKEQSFQVDINTTDLKAWTRRYLMKQTKSNTAKPHKINLRIVSWNIDSSKPTELERPSVRNKKKRNRLSSLSPFRRNKLDSNSSNDSLPLSNIDLAVPVEMEDPLIAMFKAKSFDEPDLIVVGFQEVVDLESKRVHAKSIFKKKDKPKTPHDLEERRYKDWLYAIEASIEQVYDNKYKLLKSDSLIGLFLICFIKKELHHSVQHFELVNLKTGLKGFHGNKGAICARLVLFDTSIAFIVAHLAAGQKHVAERNKDVKHILNNVQFSHLNIPTVYLDTNGIKIWDQDIIFFFGDLNYRIEMSRHDCEYLIKQFEMLQSTQLNDLLNKDQLEENRLKNPSCLLRHFKESIIRFVPTYKYDPYSNCFDSSDKQRIPAWCDRILYNGAVESKLYGRLERPISSDHKPVFGEFVIQCEALGINELLLMNDAYLEIQNKLQKLEYVNTVNTILNAFDLQNEVANFIKQNMNIYKYLQSLKLNRHKEDSP